MNVKQKRGAEAAAMLRGATTTKLAAPSLKARRLRAGKPRRVRVLDLIEEKVRLERLHPEDALIQKVHALFEPAKLPRAIRAVAAPSKCTTPQVRRVVREVREHYERLSPKAKKEISKYVRLKRSKGGYLVEYPGGER